jgi:Flp pilus assembly protein TadD
VDTHTAVIGFSALTGGISAVSTVWHLVTSNKPKPKVMAGRVAVIVVSSVVIAYMSMEPAKTMATLTPVRETATDHYQKGKQYFFDHNRPMAIKEAKLAIAIEPTHEEAHKLLGACYGVDQNMDAAAAEYQEASDINPDDVEARLGLATAEEALGERIQATIAYRYVINHPQSTANQHEIALARLKALGQ